MLSQKEIDQLRLVAKQAAGFAYHPYSGFAVGAALLLNDGEVVSGCNVENASFGLTICAERNALFGAVARGGQRHDFKALVIYTPGDKACTACGACRQVIVELMSEHAHLLSVCDSDDIIQWHVSDILPDPFRLER